MRVFNSNNFIAGTGHNEKEVLFNFLRDYQTYERDSDYELLLVSRTVILYGNPEPQVASPGEEILK